MPRPSRIVCLCPSITEALFDLGAGKRVVGVTEYCVHPRDAVESIQKVGGSKLPDLPALYQLKPDLVIMNEEENRVEDFQSIRDHGIPVLNTFPRKVVDTAPMLRQVGAAVGCEQAAEQAALAVERAVAAARDACRDARPIPAYCFIWMRPFMTINSDTFTNDMMELAGFRNICASRSERYPKVTKEELAAARMEHGLEVILLPNEPFEFVPQHATEISSIAMLPTKRAVLCDGQYLTWYGTRTVTGIQYMSRLAARVRGFDPV